MKLRLDGASVRLRVSAEELAALSASGEVAVATVFPDGARLTYCLRAGTRAPRVSFAKDTLTIELDERSLLALREGPDEGVYHEAPAAGGAPLRFYVERDRATGPPTGQ